MELKLTAYPVIVDIVILILQINNSFFLFYIYLCVNKLGDYKYNTFLLS